MPPGTRRFKCYELGLKSGRIVINDGLGSLWEKYNERKRVKKYERNLSKSAAEVRLVVETSEVVSYDPFEMPRSGETVDVSIIIPVHNKIDYTYRCLKSISRNTSGSYEVIVVDDASADNTSEVLGKIKNLQVEINKENLGFVGSCNKGGKAGRGKYLLFLNNDTIVQKNWLEPMIRMIGQSGVGAVGAKLVYPDGKLQEAGGIVWNDASGMNYGRGDDPNKSEYNFVREVDYCSGAALLVRKDLFDSLGGFDERFKPGYYEDTDICFAIRKMGYKVIYQPQSVVVHYEGATSGTDPNSGMKKYQEINRSKFFEKWQTTLISDHYPPDAVRYSFTGRNRAARKNILVIDHYVPTYDKDSGSLRMYNMLRILNELGYGVTFIGDNLAKLEPYTASLQQLGIEVIYYPSVSSIDGYMSANGKYFDVSILSRAHIAVNHVNNVRKYCVNAKIIFDTVDLQFLREMRRYELEKEPQVLADVEKFKTMEYQIMRLCDRTWVVSPYEKDLISRDDPGIAVDVVSNIHEVHPTTNTYAVRKDLLFIGGFIHKPNVDAVLWFVKAILPLIHRKKPDIKLYVIGSEPPANIASLASNNVIITGFVEDPANYFNDCRAFVAPLRYGAGVKGKINQSMSYGLPVVTTTIGAEGMGLSDGRDVLIADEPEKFAEKVMELYDNEELWSLLSSNSIKNIQDVYSFEVNKKIIGKLIDEINRVENAAINVNEGSRNTIDVTKEIKYCCDGYTDIIKQYSQMLDMGIPQTEINKMGEIEYRKRAAFGEPDKVLAMCKSRIDERRLVFEKLKGRKIKLSRFLEIGSERGQTALYLSNEENAAGVGLDISAESLKVSREIKKYMNYPGGPEFICSDACRLPFKDESFEFVFCFQTLHHFATIAPLLDEIKRILKPGGHFFFAEEGCRENANVPIWPDRNDVEELKYNIIENAFTRDVWEKEMSKFERIYTEYCPLFEGYNHISALLKKP
jgi:GT2 family glycosyltransferase/SAM-dependent methyltransferase